MNREQNDAWRPSEPDRRRQCRVAERGLQEQSLHLAAFDLLLLLDQVEWECESRSRAKPALQRREQVACFLLSGYHDA